MRGVALTVFEGSTPDSFEVEIVGVLKGSSAAGDIVLIRALGERMAATGIASGMSGSPVFVDGKLLGALRFAFTNAKEPVAGVTPFSEMLAALGSDFSAAADGPLGAGARADAGVEGGWVDLPSFPEWRRLCGDPEEMARRFSAAVPVALAPTVKMPAGFVQISLPLVFDGVDAGGPGSFDPFWNRLGLRPLGMSVGSLACAEGGTATAEMSAQAAPQFRPGDAIGINLVSGDMNVAAIGTVTWAEGREVLALGHSFLFGGGVEFPVSRAHIHTIIPSHEMSFKLGSALTPVGTLISDKRTGVAALLGRRAATVPLDVTVISDGGERRDFHFEVARHVLITPAFLSVAVFSALTSRAFGRRVSTLASELRVTLDDGRTLERRDLFRALNLEQAVAAQVMAPVSYLAASPFASFPVRAVAVELQLFDDLRAANVDRLRVPRTAVRPGDKFEVEVRLQQHLGGHETQRLTLQVPNSVRGNRLLVMAGSATAFAEWDQERAPEKYHPRKHDDLLRLLEEYPSEESLIVRLYGASRGVVLRGQELSSLPISKWHALSRSATGGEASVVAGAILDEKIIAMGAVILGGEMVELTISR
jgi:hypothetical protein